MAILDPHSAPNGPRYYWAWMLAGVLGAALLAAAAAIGVDPYRAFGTPPVEGWTLHKPRIYQRAFQAKRWQLARLRPRAVLLGNSRVEVGIDPQSPIWPDSAQPVFNAGLAGHRLASASEMLRIALAAGDLREAYIGLDFVDYLPRAERPGPEPASGTAEPPRDPWRDLQDRFAAMLTLAAVLDAVATLAGQNTSAVDMTPAGFNPMREYAAEARRTGFHRLFEQKAAGIEAQLRRLSPSGFEDRQSGEFASLRQIMAAAGEAGIGITLFIHPYHANYLEDLRRHGLWESFEAWKRALVALLEDAPKGTRLIDFSGYDEATTERVPPPGDTRTGMRYHWEAGHYSAAMGDRVIAGLLGAVTHGRPLRSDTLNATLEEVRASRVRFLNAQEKLKTRLPDGDWDNAVGHRSDKAESAAHPYDHSDATAGAEVSR